jgi:hypothetical protein
MAVIVAVAVVAVAVACGVAWRWLSKAASQKGLALLLWRHPCKNVPAHSHLDNGAVMQLP